MRKRTNKWDKQAKRKQSSRKLHKILIVCKSSADYLDSFPWNEDLVDIIFETGAGVPKSLVQKAVDLSKLDSYNEVYCVFDRDDHPEYRESVIRANDLQGFHAIWSNQCFELWYILHFQYQNTGMHRNDIYKKLKALLGDYEKKDVSIYSQLRELIDSAIVNSEKLYFETQQITDQPWNENPCTKVHILVKKLIDFCDDF